MKPKSAPRWCVIVSCLLLLMTALLSACQPNSNPAQAATLLLAVRQQMQPAVSDIRDLILVLMDINLPDLNGLEVTRHLRVLQRRRAC